MYLKPLKNILFNSLPTIPHKYITHQVIFPNS